MTDKYIENLVLAWVPQKAELELKGLSETMSVRGAIPGSRGEGKGSEAEKKQSQLLRHAIDLAAAKCH